jgi:hypothetical protein
MQEVNILGQTAQFTLSTVGDTIHKWVRTFYRNIDERKITLIRASLINILKNISIEKK